MILTIPWSHLEVGHHINGGWEVVDLTATHITVKDEDEDGNLTTFRRKDPWEHIQIEALPLEEITRAFGGHLIEEDVEGTVTFFAWPEDVDFINAAQSHLGREHGVDVGERTYDELRALHDELHQRADVGHQHVTRK